MSTRREALVARFRLTSAERIDRARRALADGDDLADDATRREVLRDLHTLKGEARMLGFAAASGLAHAIEERLAGARAGRGAAVRRALDVLDAALGDEGGGADAERAVAAAVEELVEEAMSGAAAEDTPASAPESASRSAPIERRSERWMRVDAGDVDELCERVAGFAATFGQLQSRVAAARKAEVSQEQAIAEDLERCGVELDELVAAAWALRLVPVEPTLGELAEHAREIARQEGKPLRVEIRASGVELERSVLEGLWDPLLHLVRNAVDHGVEAPGERGAKDPEATLHISAKSDGASVILSVQDDGRGLDPEALRRTAAERGVLDPEAARALSDEAALGLIFLHGFSTRTEATDLSGRGVGLDVVKDRVEALGGEVTMRAERGRGARFALAVPSSVTRERTLVVAAGGALYGLLARSVRAVVRPGRSDVSATAGGDALLHDGDALPLRSLGASLGVGADAEEPIAVVVEASGKRWAFTVAAVLGERGLLRRPVDPIVASLGPISGSATLDDGRLVLLLRPAGLAAFSAHGLAAPPARAKPSARGRVLIVDDSPIVRGLLSDILASAGVEVDVATDGADALAKIAYGRPDVVVSDVEMPRMDGFELLRRIREQSRRLPVVMVTTRGSAEDRRRAAALGADAYVSKSAFDGATLLDAIGRFVEVRR